MPKLKERPEEKRRKDFAAAVAYGCKMNDLTEGDLAERIGINRGTFSRLKKDPDGFKVRHICRMADVLKIPVSELLPRESQQ